MRAALLLVSFATLPLAACFGDEGGVVDATLTVTPPPTVAAASTAAATTTPQTPTATTTPEPTTTPSATPPIEGGAVCVNDPDRSSTVPGLLVDGEAFAEECCDKQTEVEHRRASRGSPILCYLRTDLHGSSFAVPRDRERHVRGARPTLAAFLVLEGLSSRYDDQRSAVPTVPRMRGPGWRRARLSGGLPSASLPTLSRASDEASST